MQIASTGAATAVAIAVAWSSRTGRARSSCHLIRGHCGRRGACRLRGFKVDLGPTSGALWRSAQQIVQNVDDGGDVSLRATELVLQGRIQSAREGSRVDALPVVLHRFDDGPGADVASLLLRGSFADLVSEHSFGQFSKGLREVPGCFRQGRILHI